MNDNLAAFLKVIDPTDNRTGGGTASAVAGAMAAGLVAMVARLSRGKKGMLADEFYGDITDEAQKIADLLFTGARIDSEAFEAVSAAYQMPRQSQTQKTTRQQVIAQAMQRAARIPLENAGHCRRVLELRQRLQQAFNPNAASDLECAGHLGSAALKGCAANVAINLPYIVDQVVAGDLERALGELRTFIASEP